MKATIIAIGKCRKNSPEKQLIDEYIKRSGWEVTIKEHDNASQEEEAKFLLSSIPAGAKAVVLDERGENMKSLELAAKAEKWMLDGCSEICFLVPMMNIVNGGKHADNPIDIQEFMIMPVSAYND